MLVVVPVMVLLAVVAPKRQRLLHLAWGKRYQQTRSPEVLHPFLRRLSVLLPVVYSGQMLLPDLPGFPVRCQVLALHHLSMFAHSVRRCHRQLHYRSWEPGTAAGDLGG